MAHRGTPKKMTTAEYRRRLSTESNTPKIMCWEAALTALKITFQPVGTGKPVSYITSLARAAGYEVSSVDLTNECDAHYPVTLAVFMHNHALAPGQFIIFTAHHAIALSDGLITDTVGDTATVKRTVTSAYELTAREDDLSQNPYRSAIRWLNSQDGMDWSRTRYWPICCAVTGIGGTIFASLKIEILDSGAVHDVGPGMRWQPSTTLSACDCADPLVFGHGCRKPVRHVTLTRRCCTGQDGH